MVTSMHARILNAVAESYALPASSEISFMALSANPARIFTPIAAATIGLELESKFYATSLELN